MSFLQVVGLLMVIGASMCMTRMNILGLAVLVIAVCLGLGLSKSISEHSMPMAITHWTVGALFGASGVSWVLAGVVERPPPERLRAVPCAIGTITFVAALLLRIVLELGIW